MDKADYIFLKHIHCKYYILNIIFNYSGLVPKLKTLNVSHNPITVPPKDIIVLGYSSILNYLRTEWNKLHPDEPVTFVESKNF